MIIFEDHMFDHLSVHKANNINVLLAHCINKAHREFIYSKELCKQSLKWIFGYLLIAIFFKRASCTMLRHSVLV